MSHLDQNKTELNQVASDALQFIQNRSSQPLTNAGVAVAADYAEPSHQESQEIINKNIEMAQKASFDPDNPLYEQ